MSTTIPALSSVTDILDTDLVMVTHSNGESFKIAGSEINKRNQAVIANSTTLTGAPLKTGNIVRVYFTADITGSNTSTGLTLNYNGVNKSVKVPKNGTLANFVASDLGGSPTVYKYLQAHTTLELLYDGTQFIIIGNPVVLSSSDYTIYADGKILKEWRSINVNYTATNISVSLVEIDFTVPSFEEAVFITNVDSNVIKFDPSSNEVISATYMHYTEGGIYDVAYDIYYDRLRNKILFRQTIKGSNAVFVTIKKMFYR